MSWLVFTSFGSFGERTDHAFKTEEIIYYSSTHADDKFQVVITFKNGAHMHLETDNKLTMKQWIKELEKMDKTLT